MDNENLKIYNEVREVPKNAQKEIKGGRLKGMTDINPMWRIQKLTEIFGPCGKGWFYKILDKNIVTGANEEKIAIVDIALHVKFSDNEWSEAILGTGGSSFVAKETNGLYTSDECFKMALTDALSVACKALGFGADIYWNKNDSKYSLSSSSSDSTPRLATTKQQNWLYAVSNKNDELCKRVLANFGYTSFKEIKADDVNAIKKAIDDEINNNI